MTYVRDQTSAELRAHMRELKAMRGWGDPLADRLWQEIETLDVRLAGALTELRRVRDLFAKREDANEAETINHRILVLKEAVAVMPSEREKHEH